MINIPAVFEIMISFFSFFFFRTAVPPASLYQPKDSSRDLIFDII